MIYFFILPPIALIVQYGGFAVSIGCANTTRHFLCALLPAQYQDMYKLTSFNITIRLYILSASNLSSNHNNNTNPNKVSNMAILSTPCSGVP